MAPFGRTANCLQCPRVQPPKSQARRPLPQNPHPTKSMTTHCARPSVSLLWRSATTVLVSAWIAGGLAGDGLTPAQENPNRPPWAQKSKTSAGSAKSAAQGDDSDAVQDRGKIKVTVNLVTVLVSVLDE